jgi:hypothetical protein
MPLTVFSWHILQSLTSKAAPAACGAGDEAEEGPTHPTTNSEAAAARSSNGRNRLIGTSALLDDPGDSDLFA